MQCYGTSSTAISATVFQCFTVKARVSEIWSSELEICALSLLWSSCIDSSGSSPSRLIPDISNGVVRSWTSVFWFSRSGNVSTQHDPSRNEFIVEGDHPSPGISTLGWGFALPLSGFLSGFCVCRCVGGNWTREHSLSLHHVTTTTWTAFKMASTRTSILHCILTELSELLASQLRKIVHVHKWLSCNCTPRFKEKHADSLPKESRKSLEQNHVFFLLVYEWNGRKRSNTNSHP